MNERIDLARLLAELEPKVRAEFDRALQRHAARIDMQALADALARGDVEAAERIANIEGRELFPLGEILRGVFFGSAALVGRNRRGVVGEFSFDGSHPEAEGWVRESGAQLVTRITEESRDAVRTAVLTGLEESRSHRSVALDIAGRRQGEGRVGGFVGLTGPQAASITKARAALASGDPARMREYLNRKLRDRRFDAMIRKAIRDGKPVKAPDLDRILAAHRAKALGYRGKIIAQAETFKAAAAGRDEAYRQMLNMPGVIGITKKWQHGFSAEPRVDHVRLNNSVVDLEAGFIMDDGTVMRFPHDDQAPARHVIGCRCSCVYRVIVEKG